ncbi:alpha/beta hydrolase [Pedobacter metabolipauper]|uniref:Acetyl esterase/lipase n=1 Tax=Pedobacter metabolipauper TaxID=425513 RepID=A0A4R6SZL4_9SPHI|nr:alpha/beta hydrolase [Pedobacter metabolipauper]TDQ11527.1 acetyl esterase/lipase [Pedobacter metabolipauper]
MKTKLHFNYSSLRMMLIGIIMILLIVTSFQSFAQVRDWSADERISTGTREFLKLLNTGGPGLETLKPEDARMVLVNAQKSVKVDLSGVTMTEKTIKSGGYSVKLNIVKPAGARGALPVFIFTHGGGWVLGDFPTHERMVHDLVVRTGFAGVFIEYTRTPDAPYPQALNECYEGTKWVAEHGSEIGIDGKNLAIVGNSAGGNLATATVLMAKAKNGPKIKLQILMWPTIDTDFNTESYQQFATDRFLTAPVMKWMYDLYATDPKQRQEIYYSPLKAGINDLKGLPVTLIQVAENDILRDEGEAYGRKLDAAGVNVTTLRYDGMIHDFGLLNGLAYLPQTAALFDHAALALKKYLK